MGAAEEAVVLSTSSLGAGFSYLQLRVDRGVWQASQPGRYLMVSVGDGRDPYLPRPYWARRSSEGVLSLLLHTEGRGSQWLADRHVGDCVRFYGPLGRELRPAPRSARVLLHCDASGMMCGVALAESALARSLEVALVISGEDTSLLLPLLPPDVELLPSLDATALQWADELYSIGSQDEVARAQELLRSWRRRLPAVGLPHVPLACGVGACYGCAVRTRHGQKLSCVDGPAFPLQDLLWT